MKSVNIVTEALRVGESGLTWQELLSGASGTLELDPRTTVRVRAAAGLTVTIEGILAATMISGEVILFNTGDSDPTDAKRTCTFTVSGNAFVQIGREKLFPPQQ